MNRYWALVLASVFLLSLLRWRDRVSYLRFLRDLHRGPVSLRCRVISDALPFERSLDALCSHAKFRLFFKGATPPLEYGDVVKVKGVAFVPVDYRNPGSFSVVDAMDREGVALFVKVRRWRVLSKGKGPMTLLHRLRMRLVAFAMGLDSPFRGFVLATVLGEKGLVEERSVFYRLGLGHILAVSGLHLGIFIFVLYWLFRWLLRPVNLAVGFPFLLLPRRLAHLFVLALVPVLVVLAGEGIPVIRAALMYGAYVLFGVFLERDVELVNLVLLVLLIFVLLVPYQLASVGFQYTFLAVLLLGLVEQRLRGSSRLVRSLAASSVLPLALLPVSAYHFHRVYLLGSFFNVILLPVFSILVALVFVFFWCGYLLGGPFLYVLQLLGSLYTSLLGLMRMAASVPGIWMEADRATFTLLMGLSFLLAALLGVRLLYFLAVFCFLASLYLFYQQSRDRVVFFDMGRAGDATLVVLDGRAYLVNAGGRGREGAKALYQALVWEGVKRIDRLICALKGRVGTAYVGYLRRRMDVRATEGCDGLWEGRCRPFKLGPVSLVCRKEDCKKGPCKVLGDGVFVGGRWLEPWRVGAIKVYLEGAR